MLKRLFMIMALLCPTIAHAVDGYDQYNNTRISIVSGDKIAVGEDLGVYVWKDRKAIPVEITNVTTRGDDLELEVYHKQTNTHFFFEIAADDPGIDRLPQFDPRLPFPEVLSPGVHMGNDLLEARGNMLDRGNMIEQGDLTKQTSGLPGKDNNLLENDTRMEGEHLLYQGLQPVE